MFTYKASFFSAHIRCSFSFRLPMTACNLANFLLNFSLLSRFVHVKCECTKEMPEVCEETTTFCLK